jgi:hypothetical protein
MPGQFPHGSALGPVRRPSRKQILAEILKAPILGSTLSHSPQGLLRMTRNFSSSTLDQAAMDQVNQFLLILGW